MEMTELALQVGPYVGLAVALNFLVLLLKHYLPQYESIKSIIAIGVGACAVVSYIVSSDFALFTALCSSSLTWELFKQSYLMIKPDAQKVA
jgi:hypothetical protein